MPSSLYRFHHLKPWRQCTLLCSSTDIGFVCLSQSDVYVCRNGGDTKRGRDSLEYRNLDACAVGSCVLVCRFCLDMHVLGSIKAAARRMTVIRRFVRRRWCRQTEGDSNRLFNAALRPGKLLFVPSWRKFLVPSTITQKEVHLPLSSPLQLCVTSNCAP